MSGEGSGRLRRVERGWRRSKGRTWMQGSSGNSCLGVGMQGKHVQERSKSGGRREGGKVLGRTSLRKGWDGNVWDTLLGEHRVSATAFESWRYIKF